MNVSDDVIQQNVLDLAKKFIEVPSTKENPDKLKKVLKIAKKELQGFPFEAFESNGIPSMIVHNTNKNTKQFKIILNAHLDVVPGEKEQFYPTEKNGKLIGRGAYDMKAAAAVMILVFKELAPHIKYPLALQLINDEETGSFHGTQYHIEKGIRGEFVITGEAGSNFNIVNEAKGILHLRLTTDGSAAHSGYPWLGENAIIAMQEVIKILIGAYPIPTIPAWKTIISIVNIQTENDAFNKIPDNCILDIDVRFIREEQETILPAIKKLLPPYVTIEIIQNTPAAYTKPESEYLQILKRETEHILHKNIQFTSAYASSDIRFFTEIGCEGVEFGPIGANHHFNTGEWVDMKSLKDYFNILKNFLLSVK